MPETYNIPEPEEPTAEKVEAALAQAIAGQGVVRRVVLYAIAALLIVSPVPALAGLPLVLLLATDKGLE